jgi:hypothetical protein
MPVDNEGQSVLILGGIATLARPLALYLLDPKSPRASYVKIADRFSVSPASTYLDRPFLELLGGDKLEYQQINLSNTSRHAELFTYVDVGYDVVYDLTGEMDFDKPEIVRIVLSPTKSRSKYPIPTPSHYR